MNVLVTGATGLIGSALCEALLHRGDEVRGATRDAERARQLNPEVEWFSWEPAAEEPPVEAVLGADAVVHLAGESLAQRWTRGAKERIRDSRIQGTRNLVEAIERAEARPQVLVGGSAVGYYGDRGSDRLTEEEAPGSDWLARLCVEWETEAARAAEIGVRVVHARAGVVLSGEGGALKTMLPPFRLGVGGPVGSGRRFVPWIHLDDEVALLIWALDSPGLTGPLNLTAPEPATNRELSKALGRAIRRPAFMPVPPVALKLLYGEMSQVVVDSQRVVPARAQGGGFEWRFTDLDAALRDALGG